MIDNKGLDVVSLGELLIDFTMNGVSEQGNQLFEVNPGGAPCNVLSMLNNLGKKTSFIGKVGNDQFGFLLKRTLEELAIGTDNLVIDNEVNTTLAFVHTAQDGDRSFSFYRKPGADMMLNESEIREDIIKKAKIKAKISENDSAILSPLIIYFIISLIKIITKIMFKI